MKAGGLLHCTGRSRHSGRTGLVVRTNIPPPIRHQKDSGCTETDLRSMPNRRRRHHHREDRRRSDRIDEAGRTWEIAKPVRHAMPIRTPSTCWPARLADLNAGSSDRRPSGDLNAFRPGQCRLIEVDVTTKDGKTTKLLFGSDTPAGNRHLRQTRKRSEGLHRSDLHQDRFRQDRQRPPRQAAAHLQSGQADFRHSDRSKARPSSSAKTPRATGRSPNRSPCAPTACRSTTWSAKLKDAKMDLTARLQRRGRASSLPATKVGTASTTDNTGTQTIEIRKGKDKVVLREELGRRGHL